MSSSAVRSTSTAPHHSVGALVGGARYDRRSVLRAAGAAALGGVAAACSSTAPPRLGPSRDVVPVVRVPDVGAPRVPALARSAPGAPSNGWTAEQLQALLDSSGDVCSFPGGLIDLPADTHLVIPHGMHIRGNGTTLRVRDGVPRRNLLDGNGLRDSERLEVRDLNIEGPDTEAWDPRTDCDAAAIAWSRPHTSSGRLVISGVTVSGGYGSAVLRTGGGSVDIADSDLGGWVDGLAVFDSHGSGGSVQVRDSILRAPAHSKYSSIGAYIHPHVDIDFERVTAVDWNRFGVYVNGSPPSEGSQVLTEVTAVDCALVQTGSGTTTVLDRCREWGTPRNGGTLLKGAVRSTGSRWESAGAIGVLAGNDVERRFVDDVIVPRGIWMALGEGTRGRVVIESARADLTGRAAMLKLVRRSTAHVTVDSSSIHSTTRSFPINVEGGTVELVRTARPANSRQRGTGRLLG